MFGTLLESKSRRRRRARVAIVSVAAHAVAITLASAATRRPPVERPTPVRDPSLIYIAPPVERHDVARSSGHGTPAPGRTVPTPTITPVGLPPIGPVKIELSDPVIGGAPGESLVGSIPTGGGGATSSSTPDGGVYRAVERAAAALPGAPRARYPESLRQASIEGQAVLRFVVDTTGRVEPGSVETASATHALFAQAARQALAGTRFAPAEVGGRRVRQLVEQAYAFTLDR